MSRFWHAFFPRFYRALRLADPFLGAWLRRFRLGNTVEVTVRGRRTGRPRRVFLGLLQVDGRTYLGHPNGECAWTRNADAAGRATIRRAGRTGQPVRPALVPPGPERDRVIGATFRQHPFPGDVIYWLARGHVRAVGRFYRVEPIEAAAAD